MTNEANSRTLGLVETQPATVEGLRSIIGSAGGFSCRWSAGSLMLGMQLLRQDPVDIVLVDKALGLQTVIDTLATISSLPGRIPNVVVWGTSMSEPEALKLLQAGARGILRKTADISTILACLRTVASHAAWMEDCVFREAGREDRMVRHDLTVRERQVLELVEQGMRNKEIAHELGIRPGTVKIHLKHIFEKTGVHGRYGLALSGFRRKGLPSAVDEGPVAVSAA
jgi:DNA-binding NarL/FixJ family response regulator